MSLAELEESDLLAGVNPPGDDLDGELVAGGPGHAPPAHAEAPISQDLLLQVNLKLI